MLLYDTVQKTLRSSEHLVGNSERIDIDKLQSEGIVFEYFPANLVNGSFIFFSHLPQFLSRLIIEIEPDVGLIVKFLPKGVQRTIEDYFFQ